MSRLMQYTNQFACGCGCWRIVTTRHWHYRGAGPFYASNACRQRAYRKRKNPVPTRRRGMIRGVTVVRSVERNAKKGAK